MSAHHPSFSPSSGLPRAHLCPGSVGLVAMLRAMGLLHDRTNPAAEEGKLLHSKLRPEASLDDLTEEQTRHVENARRFIAERTRGPVEVRYEVPMVFLLPGGEVLTFGTADVVAIFADGRVVVIDLKFGRAAPSETFVLIQGAAYVRMAMDTFSAERGEFWFFHPRLEIQHHALFHGLEAVTARILGIVERVKKDPRLFVPGPEQCTYCDGLGVCGAAADAGTRILEHASEIAAISAEQFGVELNRVEFVEGWAKARKERAIELIESGARVPGWGVKDMAGDREILDLDMAIALLDGVLTAEEVRACGRLSIVELENRFVAARGGKKKAALAEFARRLDGVVTRGPSSKRVVRVKE